MNKTAAQIKRNIEGYGVISLKKAREIHAFQAPKSAALWMNGGPKGRADEIFITEFAALDSFVGEYADQI